MNKYQVLIFGMMMLMSGCGLFKGGSGTPEQQAPVPVTASAVSRMEESAVRFTTLSMNAEITIKIDETNNSVSGMIRIRKDSMIWISARKLGFEIGRLMLSRDSVWVLDRINSRYFAGDYSYFRQQFNLEVDYNLVEAMLLANPLDNWSAGPVQVGCDDPSWCSILYPERYRINQGSDAVARPEGSTVMEEHITLSKSNGRILTHRIGVKGEQRSIAATYEKYNTVQKQLFPSLTRMEIDNRGATTILIFNADNPTLNQPETFPFKIPASYQKMKTQ
jgi:hypothetical protein